MPFPPPPPTPTPAQEGESVATYLHREGSRAIGQWMRSDDTLSGWAMDGVHDATTRPA